MNRLLPSPFCRVCLADLAGKLRRTDLVFLRTEYTRMIDNGLCDNCQSDRMEAAMEYENAAAEMRLVTLMGANWSRSQPPILHPALRQAMKRLDAADAWCVRLKMWPARSRPKREVTA